LNIYSAFSGKTIETIEKEFEDANMKKFKEALAELVIKEYSLI